MLLSRYSPRRFDPTFGWRYILHVHYDTSSRWRLPAAACAAALFIACAETSSARAVVGGAHELATRTTGARDGAHGMVLFGEGDSMHLSHIPMFHAPHDVQLVVTGALDGAGGVAPRDCSESLFTYLPEPFALDELRAGRIRVLRGTLYRGNFENGGVPIARGIGFLVRRIVYNQELRGDALPSSLSYLLFGSRRRAFAVHRIVAAPGFDHVVRIEPPEGLDDDALAGALPVTAEGGVVDASARLVAPRAFTTPSGATVNVVPLRTLSCLSGPDFNAPCP